MSLRVPVSFVLGGLVTFALFFMIQKMITPGDPAEAIAVRSRLIDFVRLKRDQDIEVKKRALPERPTQPRKLPPVPEMEKVNLPKPRSAPSLVQTPRGSLLGFAGPSQFGFPGEDADALPLFRVPPQYPIHAERRGLEGWVDLEFTISKTGRVIDPKVLGANPAGVFDQAAKTAVTKWKYRPKVDRGAAVERTGIRVRIRFELQDGR